MGDDAPCSRLATHYYALLAVVPEAVWLLALYHRRRTVQLAMALAAACGLGLMALAVSQNATGRANWIATAPLGRRLAEVAPQFLVGFGSIAYNGLVWAAIGLCLVALALLATFGSPAERRRTLAVGAIAIGGLAINLAFVVAGIDDLLTRNMIALWIPAALLIAGSLAIARAHWAGVAVTVGLCAIGIAAAVSVAADRYLQRPDWRGVARVLGSRPALGSGGRAILIQHYKDLLPLSLNLPRLNALPPHAGVRVRELDIISFTDPRTAASAGGARPATCGPHGSRSPTRSPASARPGAGRSTSSRSCALWLIARACSRGDRLAGADGDEAAQRRAALPALVVRERRRSGPHHGSGSRGRRSRARFRVACSLLDADRVADIRGSQGVPARGRTGDRRAVRAGGVAPLPLVGKAGRGVGPARVGLGEGLALGHVPRDRRAHDVRGAVKRQHNPCSRGARRAARPARVDRDLLDADGMPRIHARQRQLAFRRAGDR